MKLTATTLNSQVKKALSGKYKNLVHGALIQLGYLQLTERGTYGLGDLGGKSVEAIALQVKELLRGV